MSYISPNLNYLLTIVKKISNSLSRDFSEMELLQSSVKNPKDFVTSATERMARALRTELQKTKPNYAVVFGNEPRPSVPFFLISALDGVVNFSHAVPYFAVSLAMIENDVITLGMIYNPITGDMFFAEKGKGAFKEGSRNHERLRVSGRKNMADALIGAKDAADVTEGTLRIQGSVAMDLAYVAAGRLDAIINKENDAAAVAAGLLLVKEAGGHVYELNQKDIRSDELNTILASGNVIAGNAELGKKLHESVNK